MADTDAIFHEMGFTVTNGRLAEAVLYSIARTAELLTWQLSPLYKRAGLTPASFNLLMLLKHGRDVDTLTQHTMGQRLVASASDMSGLIDRLERKGLVRRAPGKDRRSKRLEITPRGNKVIEQIWDQHLAAVDELAKPLSKTEATALVHALARLREGVQP